MVQSIPRKPEVELLQSIQGIPWAARGSREALELPEPLAIPVEQPDVAPEETQTASYKAHFKNVYIYDRMTLRSLDIPQDAKLAHLFEIVLIGKEFLTTEIAVQELFRGCRKQSMAERELRLQGRRRKVPRVNQRRNRR